MSDTILEEEPVDFPYSKLFAETVWKTIAVVVTLTTIFLSVLYFANLAGAIEAIDWTDLIMMSIYNATIGVSPENQNYNGFNPGAVSTECLFLPPPNCNKPNIVLPEAGITNPA